MFQGDISPGGESLRFLELLAREAPAPLFEELIRQAAQADAAPEVLERLTQAKELALEINSLSNRRQQREAGLSALVDTARELTLRYDLDTLLNVITRRARLLLHLGMSWVTLRDGEGGSSVVRAADGHASAITVGFLIPDTGGLGNAATEQAAPLWTPDYLADDRFPHAPVIDDVVRAEGLHSLIAIPLVSGRNTVGVLYGSDRNIRHFTPEEITLMSSLGDLGTVAIEKAQLLHQVQAKVAELELSTAQALDSSAAAQQLHDTHGRLIDLVLGGRGLHALISLAAEELGGSLLMRDPSNKTVISTGGIPGLDERNVLSASLDCHAKRQSVRSAEGLWLHPVSAGQENLGTLILHTPSPPTEQQLRLLPTAARTVAALLLIQSSTTTAEGQAQEDLFKDLLNASQSPQQLSDRAHRLSLELDQPHVLVVARPEGGAQGRAVIWSASYASRTGGLKSVDVGCLVFLLPGSDPDAAAQAIVDELSSVLGHPVTAGAAGPLRGPASVHVSYQEARRCLDTLTSLGSTGTAASVGQLGFLGLLLSDDHDVTGFIQNTVGPVVEYDTQQGTELLRTLGAYFAAGNSPTRAAESLHVHTNTVARRLERISELLGADWQEPANALEIQLALRCLRTQHTLRQRRDASAVKGAADRGGR